MYLHTVNVFIVYSKSSLLTKQSAGFCSLSADPSQSCLTAFVLKCKQCSIMQRLTTGGKSARPVVNTVNPPNLQQNVTNVPLKSLAAPYALQWVVAARESSTCTCWSVSILWLSRHACWLRSTVLNCQFKGAQKTSKSSTVVSLRMTNVLDNADQLACIFGKWAVGEWLQKIHNMWLNF